jgi:hypothetical protein
MDLPTARTFVEAPFLTRLTILDLGNCNCEEEVWETILAAPNLKHLKWLNLSMSTVGGVAWLAEDPRYRRAFERQFGPDVIEWNQGKVDIWDKPRNPVARFWSGLKWS